MRLTTYWSFVGIRICCHSQQARASRPCLEHHASLFTPVSVCCDASNMHALAIFLIFLRNNFAYNRAMRLSAEEVERIRAAVKGWDLGFEVLYGGESLAVPVLSR